MNALHRACSTAAVALLTATNALAAQVVNPPELGPAPHLTLPAVSRATLPNGITVMVARNAELPIVEVRLIIDGGQRLAGTPPGLAPFTAAMLSEGAAGRDAFKFAEDVAFLGASLNASAGWESFIVSLRAPKRNIADALSLMADLVLRPSFPSASAKRLRDLRIAGLIAARDRPNSVASRVFYRNVYPNEHPYHADLSGDSASVASFDSSTVRNFWNRATDPRRATIVFTGDVTMDEATRWATANFASWHAPTSPLGKPAAATIAEAPHTATRLILVDKPNAAQSVILVGTPGLPRTSPDYPAVTLMNTILGGSFSARLNDILREQLGYTYGANSGFSWQPVPGPFVASSAVRTNVTDSSLMIVFREIRRMRDEPVSAVELERGKKYIVLGELDAYETPGEVAGAIVSSVTFNRPLSETLSELNRIDALTAADVQRAAQKYLDPSHLTVVVVGDLSKIRAGIEQLHLGRIEVQTY